MKTLPCVKELLCLWVLLFLCWFIFSSVCESNHLDFLPVEVLMLEVVVIWS